MSHVYQTARYRSGARFVAPFKIKFYLTDRCNLKCRHCNIWTKTDHSQELTSLEYRRFFEKNRTTKIVSFSGGEPSQREDLSEILRFSSEYSQAGIILSLNINGFRNDLVEIVRQRLSSDAKLARLIVAVSQDGPARVHDDIRRQKNSHRRTEETIAALTAISDPRLKVRRAVCISPYNIDIIVEYLKSLKAAEKKYYTSFFQVAKHYAHRPEDTGVYRNFKNQMIKMLPQIQKIGVNGDILGGLFLDLAAGYFNTKQSKQTLPCHALFSSIVVDPKGEVFPCINFNYSLGNLREVDFDLDKMLCDPKAKKAAELIRKNKCPGCWTPNDAYPTMMANIFSTRLPTVLMQNRIRKIVGHIQGGWSWNN
jgi:MoaA/NifB/PqqE/SkfB family radical SAM enzyme